MTLFTVLPFSKAGFIRGLLFAILTTGCSPQSDRLDQVYRIAGGNRAELEKVLAHYEDQPLKLKAARFLIGNMGHGFRHGPIMDAYQAAILSCPPEGVAADSVWLSLSEGENSVSSATEFIYDARVVTSDYLIDQIDQAFRAWDESPWHDRIGFSAFCRHILPYRVTTEPLSDWRETLRERYLPYIDGIDDPARAFVIIYNRVFDDFKKWSDLLYPHTMDPLILNRVMRGRCEDRSLYLTCVLRALAIPAVYDYMQFWGNVSSVSHSWVSHVRNDSTFTLLHRSDKLEYQGTIDASRFYQANHSYRVGDLPFNVDSVKRAAKIFRYCFEIQEDRLEFRKRGEEMPGFFRNLFQKDVSEEYGLSGTYRFSTDHKGYIYLCAFRTGEGWAPLAVTEAKRGKAVFNHLDREVVYLPCSYEEEEFTALAPPFCITEENNRIEFVPDETRKQEVVLKRKYLITVHWTDRWALFSGGRFEGSDTPDFSKRDVLHEITEMPTGIERIEFPDPKRYRYIRFVAPENAAPNFAEIAFLGKSSADTEKTEELAGKLIGERITDMAVSIARGTDKDYSTFFRESYRPGIPEDHYWFGYDLGVNNDYLFTGVEFCPNSDRNMIEPGDRYELLYFNERWISLGQKTATDIHVVYDDVPVGALLWLRNLTRGKEERIFTYENGQQVWW